MGSKVIGGMQWLVLAPAVVALLAFPGLAAAATVSDQYAISGYEYYATSTQGRFAGTATGTAGDDGTWNAVIDHTRLTTKARITGGSTTLLTSNLVAISAEFTGGTVKLVNQRTGCGTQQYAVTGTLGDVTRSDSSATGTGTFIATLTHHRMSVLGSCIVYSASVTGTIYLDF